MTALAAPVINAPHVMPTYARVPISLSHGQGCRVWDVEGRQYLDALGGIAVNTLGHNHPRLVAALQQQVTRLIHVSNYYHVPQQETLARMLCERSGMDNVFFCNSGLEANECALKIARKHGIDRGIERPAVVVLDHAFHGRSFATMAATANPAVRNGFGELPGSFVRVPAGDMSALEAATAGRDDIVAVLLEPIQGEGGLHPVQPQWLQQLRLLCDARGWLLMADEVQSGMGRTGRWFAHQWAAGVVPDVMTLAKGLGSGVPIGAVVARGVAAGVLKAGNHGSTFGGNPLALCAGITTIETMEAEGLLHNAAEVGTHLKAALQRELGSVAGVRDVRGLGLMVGIELDRPCGDLVGRAAQAGLLISVTASSVVRLVPPLILTMAEADSIVSILAPLLRDFLASPKS